MATRYRQIADEIRFRISSGELGPDDQIPTEVELMRYYEVSRNTVRSAIRELVVEGLLETQGRRGTRVRAIRPFVFDAQSYIGNDAYFDEGEGDSDSWAAQVRKAGREPSQTFTMKIVAAGGAIASKLGLDPDDLVCVRECEKSIDNTRWCDEISYYPRDIAEACGLDSPHDIREGTARRLYDRGFLEVKYDDRIYGRHATVEEIADFELAPGALVIIHDRQGMLKDRPSRLTRRVFPTDRNEIRYSLSASPARLRKAGLA